MGAVSSVSNVIEKAVDQVSTAIDNTAKSIEKDPVGAIATITTAIVAPELLPVVVTADAVGQGVPLDKALEKGALAYAGQQVGSLASDAVSSPTTITPDAVPAPLADPTIAKIVGSTASGATQSLLSGRDPIAGATSGLTSGVVGAGTSAGANAISDTNLQNWSQQQAENTYNNAPSPTEQDVLAADTSVPLPAPLATPPASTGAGYYDETTGAFVPSNTGVVQAPLTDTSGTNLDSVKQNADLTGLSNAQTPLDTAAVLPPPAQTPPEAYDPTKTSTIKSGLNYLANAVLAPTTAGAASSIGASSTPTSLSQQVYKDPILSSEAQYLGPKDTTSQNTITDPAKLQELQQLYASLDPQLKEALQARGIVPFEADTSTTPLNASMYNTKLVANGGSINSYASGSSVTDSYDQSVFNPTITKTNPNMLPPAPVVQMPSRLGALKNIFGSIGSRQPHLAAGGLPSKYTEAAPKGHKPEFITGLTGYYAQGKGTGQSDDIPAMLHDGDYVADADLVAALGDGSSKAGAEALEKFRRQIPHRESEGGQPVPAKIADGEYVFPASFVTAIGKGDNKAGAKLLDAMREEIRAHKRSAPTSKIPPKAKSPLDYLKMAKG